MSTHDALSNVTHLCACETCMARMNEFTTIIMQAQAISQQPRPRGIEVRPIEVFLALTIAADTFLKTIAEEIGEETAQKMVAFAEYLKSESRGEPALTLSMVQPKPEGEH